MFGPRLTLKKFFELSEINALSSSSKPPSGPITTKISLFGLILACDR